MRWTWLVGGIVLVGCIDDTYRQVGPGQADDDTDATPEGDGEGPACDRRVAQGICEEYTGSGWDEPSIHADCSGAADVLVETGCPGSALGGCDETREDPQGTIVWYYEGDYYTAAEVGALELQCVSSYDTWLAGG